MEVELAKAYGTSNKASNREVVESCAKTAGLGEKLIAGVGAAGLGLLIANAVSRQRREAELVNRAAQELETRRMAPATGPLFGSIVPPIMPPLMAEYYPPGLDSGMIRMASAIGADMAQMEKEAISFNAISFGAGKGIGGAFKAVKNTVGNIKNVASTPKINWGAASAAKAAPKIPNASVVKAPATGMMKTTPAAPTSIAAATQNSGPGLLQRTGLFDAQGNFRKGRALAAAGLIGAGYLGLKAAKKGIDYMSREPAPASYNSGGNQLQMGVNQYGYPQF